jgi:Cof subfamily protein (haloacid dehalogenase superfamily)
VAPLTTPHLIALDLDGTLLDGAGQVTPRAIDAIAAATTDGHRIVIATGRPPDMAVRATEELVGLATHIVGGNGTIISTFPAARDEQPELVHVSGFDVDAATEVITTLRHHDAEFGFALATDRGFAHEPGFAELMPAAVHDAPVDDALSIGGSTAFKLLVFHRERSVAALLSEVPALISHLGTDFAVRHMGADAVEIGPTADDKGAGLRWLCGHLGIESTVVIAVGDELNDLSMLEWAGRGVAVANADERILDIADHVIGSHVEDGVAIFLEQLTAAEDPPGEEEPVEAP